MNPSEPHPDSPSVETDATLVPDQIAPGRLSLAEGVRLGWPVVVVALAVCLCYAPNLRALTKVWNDDPDYSHGVLVVPIALAILWQRWPLGLKPQVSWVGWGALVLVLVARLWFHNRGSSWSETASVVLVIAALGLARLGWPIFQRVWPGFAFLVFLLPLHPTINASLSRPLQRFATLVSVAVLRGTGLFVMADGNVILVDSERLQVAEACNGLAMLMSLAATVAAAACLLPMTTLKRLILLASIVPIALVSNVLRISATAWAYHLWGAKIGSQYAHDAAGWLMMPVAMVLVGLELWLVSWLVIETEDDGQRGRLFPISPGTMPNLAGGPR